MKNFLKWAGIVFIALIVLSVIAGLFGGSKIKKNAHATTKDSVTVKETTETPKETAAPAKETAEASKETTEAPKETATVSSSWTYSDQEDKMTSKKTYIATVEAKDELDFKFPYNGGSVATFTIVKRSTGKTDLLVNVTKGQFMAAHKFNGGQIRIRFDEDAAQGYSVSGPSDGSATTVFLNASAKVLAKVKTARKMIVEAEFFDNGTQLMEFNVAGLTWEH